MAIRNLIALILVSVVIAADPSTHSLQKATEQPNVIEAVTPVFSTFQYLIPEADRTVVIRVGIDSAGRVISAERLSGIDVHGKAKQAALRWRFSSAEKEHGERFANLRFTLRLMPSEATEEELAPVFRPPFEIEVRKRIELAQK